VIATGGDVTLSAGATLSVTNTTVRAQNTVADANTNGTVTGGDAATGSTITAGAARTVALRAAVLPPIQTPPPVPPIPPPTISTPLTGSCGPADPCPPVPPNKPPLGRPDFDSVFSLSLLGRLSPRTETTQGTGDSNVGLGSLNPQAGGDSSGGGSGLTDNAPPAGYDGTADDFGRSAAYAPPPDGSGSGGSGGGSGKKQTTTVVLPGLLQTQGAPGSTDGRGGGSGNGDVSLTADPGGWSQCAVSSSVTRPCGSGASD